MLTFPDREKKISLLVVSDNGVSHHASREEVDWLVRRLNEVLEGKEFDLDKLYALWEARQGR
jgi:hypothetical protein